MALSTTFTQCAPETTKFDKITQKGPFRCSMSFKVTDFGTNRKLICDFLSVINTNLPAILHGCEIQPSKCQKSLYFATTLACRLPDLVPKQQQKAISMPVPKVAKPAQTSDYRPISITSVLSRALARQCVFKPTQPCMQDTPGLDFNDQFGFRPTGSNVAALIALQDTVLCMLSTNAYVTVFALNFSQAQWRNYVGSVLRQIFPRRPTEFQN